RPLHDNTAEREQNPHCGHYNGLTIKTCLCLPSDALSLVLQPIAIHRTHHHPHTNPHSPVRGHVPRTTSRGCIPCRLSNAGQCSLGTILHGRHPKPSTYEVLASTTPAVTSSPLVIWSEGLVRSALSQAANEIGANGRQLNAPAIHPWPPPAKAMKPNSTKAPNNEAITYFMRV